MLRAALGVALLLPIPTLSLTGQAGTMGTERTPARRWAVSISIGPSWGNFHRVLEQSLTAGGFNDPLLCFIVCRGNVAVEPSSSAGVFTSTFALSYLVRPHLDVRLQVVSADLGRTDGNHAPLMFLSLQQAVTSVAVFPAVSLGGILRIGAGPALHFVNVSRDFPGGAPFTPFKATKLGAVIYGGLTTSRRVFLEVAAQFTYVPSVDVGPIDVKDVNGTTTATMPLTQVTFSHPTLSVGLGVRF